MFQIGILVFSVVVVIVAVLIFSGVINVDSGPNDAGNIQGNYIIWGTLRADGIRSFLDTFATDNLDLKINYISKDPSTFSLELSDAIANGIGPDLILFSQEDILQNRGKLLVIPYANFSERTFRDTYIEEANLFLLPDGIVGFPIAVDPIVMYYNKSLFENAGYSTPPKTWDVLSRITPSLTKKRNDLVITQSAIPFGVYGNLDNAKDILSLLFIQAGEPIVAKQDRGFNATLGYDSGSESSPAQSALEFFTQFSNPLSQAYTWNRAQIPARDAFISESLVMYLGYASELPIIADKNPNLNFDITKVPQIPDARINMTFGKIYGLGVIKGGKNPQGALSVATLLSSKEAVSGITEALSVETPLAPARRDLIGTPPETSYGPVIYSSGLMARGWYDPGDYFTNPIMAELVDDVVRGASTVLEALSKARSRLQLAL